MGDRKREGKIGRKNERDNCVCIVVHAYNLSSWRGRHEDQDHHRLHNESRISLDHIRWCCKRENEGGERGGERRKEGKGRERLW